MRNNFYIIKRKELIDKLAGLPEPVVSNQEWLYLLSDETRHSIMIEGYFFSEKELSGVIEKKYSRDNRHDAILNYFRSAQFMYGLGYQYYKDNEKPDIRIAVLRQINKSLGFVGEFRKGDIKIAGAKIQPPSWNYLDEWIKIYREFLDSNINNLDSLEFLARQHALFEAIHPFQDGNGRTGRIFANYLLVSAGFPIFILKGNDEGKKKYYTALEEADKVLTDLTTKQPVKDEVFNALNNMQTKLLESLFMQSLINSFDRILIPLIQEKMGFRLKPGYEIAEKLTLAKDSMRTLIKRGEFIGIKQGNEWFVLDGPRFQKKGK
jgi:fido (protein-threonine AMPylation protein)